MSTLGPFAGYAGDLAPGDRAVLGSRWEEFSVDRVRAGDDAALDDAYGRLWREFGPRGEMERRDVIEARLGWDPQRPVGELAMLYEMLTVRRNGRVVAVRDHTAIASAALPAHGVVVHLSHVLVEPALRGSGLSSWLRALPVHTARCCARRAGADPAAALPVTLVAEMERDDGITPGAARRLASYARAGFAVVDPVRVNYHQPDFRAARDMEGSRSSPLPMQLVLRRVGREDESRIPGDELAGLVNALFAMFAVHLREPDMAAAARASGRMPIATDEVQLLVPGKVR